MMAEESSDESAELVDKEEAVSAEKQFTSHQTGISSSVAPPAPLPSFLTQTPGGTPLTPRASTSTPSVAQTTSNTPVVAQTTSNTSFVPRTISDIPLVAGTTLGSVAGTTPVSVAGTTPVSVAGTTPVSVAGSHKSSPGGVTQSPVVPGMAQTTSVNTPSAPLVSPPQVSQRQVTPPAPQVSPYEASSAISVPDMEVDPVVTQSQHGGGLFGWISGNKMISKVVQKTKSSMETMITTLDPGMKEVIKSGGQICVLVTSTKESKVGAIREAFQTVFGRATVIGKESQATTAAQPVGFTAGLKGAQERIQNLRQSENVPDDQPVVSVEGFIVEMLPDRWYELSCLVLQDPQHRIDLQTFSQPSPIPAEYILKAQDRTPKDYPLRWSGLAVTIGQIVEEDMPHIGHVDWQNGIVGVSRRESLFLAAKSLAYMYQQRLPTTFVS